MDRKWMAVLCTATLIAACAPPAEDDQAGTQPAEEVVAAPGDAAAAAAGDPVTSVVRDVVHRRKGHLVGAAQAMPAEKYSYSPTPEQMSFGHLMGHVAGANVFVCSRLSGMEAPAATKVADDAPKDAVVAALTASFDFCDTALQNVHDAQLGDSIPFFGGRMVTKAAGVIEIPADLADHYGQAAVYLRLNGILPPTAKRQGGE